MTNSAVIKQKMTALASLSPDQLSARMVTAVLLALGSNYQADYYLPNVRQRLAMLGQMTLSTAFENPDFTATDAQPKPDYTNQCVLLYLDKPMVMADIQALCKVIENECDRCRVSHQIDSSHAFASDDAIGIRRVTMDIDILLIHMLPENCAVDVSPAASGEWVIMANRYPFKAHEQAGIDELNTDCPL